MPFLVAERETRSKRGLQHVDRKVLRLDKVIGFTKKRDEVSALFVEDQKRYRRHTNLHTVPEESLPSGSPS
jgi:hypothetical protein